MSKLPTFGLWYDFRNPPQWHQPYEKMYAAYLDQIAAAEKLGFGSCWLTEHHFCDDGYTPSPLVIAAAIGARTKTMRLGTNLIILPLHNPVRIAEDVAALSLLTGGRFDLGVGIGYRQMEFAEFGRELKQRPSLMEEAVDIIRRAWAGETMNFEGKRFKVGDLKVSPQPEHLPRIFIGAMAEPAIERAARIGDGFLTTGGIGQDVFLECLKRQGKDPAAGTIIAGHWAVISDDPEAEAARVGPHILYQANQYIRWGAFGPPETTPLFETPADAIKNGLYEMWDADTAVIKLQALIDAYPQIKDIHFWAQFPGESVASGQRRLDYISAKVLPRLRPSKAS